MPREDVKPSFNGVICPLCKKAYGLGLFFSHLRDHTYGRHGLKQVNNIRTQITLSWDEPDGK